MSVSRADYSDIPAIVGIMERAVERSTYAGVATFDAEDARQTVLASIHRHGHTNLGGRMVLVSRDGEGKVVGFVIGIIDQIYPGLREHMVTDLLFICEDGTPPADPPAMLRALIDWGAGAQRVKEAHFGISGAIGDPERTAKLYERAGLERCGLMYRMEV